jgi:hypothetical protein
MREACFLLSPAFISGLVTISNNSQAGLLESIDKCSHFWMTKL